MRQQREKTLENSKFELNDEAIMTLGKYLDSKAGLAIDEVYFTSKGWYFNYVQVKKEKYAYLDFIPIYNQELKAYKYTKVPTEENRVISTMDASEIVDKYLKLKKNLVK